MNGQPAEPTAADFAPAQRASLLEHPGRPARPYWRLVGWRLLRNPRALVSAAVILVLLLGTLLGPLLWPRDPSAQSLGQASQGPHGSLSAQVVVHRPWTPPPVSGETGLRAVEAHTEWVRLAWPVREGASGYRVYRHERLPRDANDLGLPIGEVPGGVTAFEDRLQLRPRAYHYSVVAVYRPGERGAPQTLLVEPSAAIELLAAQLQGLVPADAGPEYAGRVVTLPAHPLGTDYLGRDLLARVLHGGRTSLFIGIVAPLVFVLFGTVYGAVAGYVGGRLDNVMMRFADFVVALPFLLFMILFRIAFGIGPGESGVFPLVLALVVLSWPSTARLVRGQVLQLREEPYVEAARLSGAGGGYIIGRHLLPNVLGVVLVSLTFAIPSAIFTEAFLSFIGMGVSPPTPSWGAMSRDGMRTLLTHPQELLVPALCISLTVLAFNLFGDALRDALDVRLGERG